LVVSAKLSVACSVAVEDAAKPTIMIGLVIHHAVILAMDAATGPAMLERVAMVHAAEAAAVVSQAVVRQHQTFPTSRLAVARWVRLAERPVDAATNEQLFKCQDEHFTRLGLA